MFTCAPGCVPGSYRDFSGDAEAERKARYRAPLRVLAARGEVELQRLALQFEKAFIVLENFRCNVIAAATCMYLLHKVTLFFTTPVDGLLARANKKKLIISHEHCPLLLEMEELLAETFMYMERFTEAQFFEYMLVGKQPQLVMTRFEGGIKQQALAMGKQYLVKSTSSVYDFDEVCELCVCVSCVCV